MVLGLSLERGGGWAFPGRQKREVWAIHPFSKGTGASTSMAPLRTGVQGWLNLFAIFLTNYGFHLSRGHASSSQEADYVGVSEAAGLQSLQSVRH